jgi:DMSO/TMAO reductase YedYZ molybdopterin-dependent catalytic subunit
MTYVIFMGFDMFHKSSSLVKFLLVGVVFSLLFANLAVGVLATTSDETQTLESVEIREYEGEDLSSINDFLENSIIGPQYIGLENYTLSVTGLVKTELNLTYDEVVNNYQSYKKVVTLHCIEGWSVTLLWEGIQLTDLIANADVDPEANTVVFYAYDGYSTSLPLDYIVDNNILMAYKMNNLTLPPERGFPFELVAESKWGYKWIKWITRIELSSNADYLGYWESRGLSNTANIAENDEEITPVEVEIQNYWSDTYGSENIPEFPPSLVFPLFIVATLLAVVVYRQRLRRA